MSKLCCQVHESTSVTFFILVLAIINLAFVIISTVMVGWARDYENLNQFGLWKYCSSVYDACYDYQWFQVPGNF
ncbi:hypothetical protein MXB_2544 [Myxobolus squamalis]|nr:hypothetical protein MXB_2544 [Myxobolus squamalis]